jgi:Protein of unknown function (DUF3365)
MTIPSKELVQNGRNSAVGELFKLIHDSYPEYHYKEAALNPTNQRDRADPFEANIINYFRANTDKMEWSGEEANSVTGRSSVRPSD